MAYPKEIEDIVKTIPKEHHKDIQFIIKFYYNAGVARVQEMIKGISDIKPEFINDYDVWHNDDIAGG